MYQDLFRKDDSETVTVQDSGVQAAQPIIAENN
jgi:hypothetical protein